MPEVAYLPVADQSLVRRQVTKGDSDRVSREAEDETG